MITAYRNLCFGFFLFLHTGTSSVAQEIKPFEGFGPFAWGTSIDDVRAGADGELEAEKPVNPDQWNASEKSLYTGFQMGPEPYVLRFAKKNAEIVEYFFVQNELAMVLHTPNMHDAFRPLRATRRIEKLYDKPAWRNMSTQLLIPKDWGQLSNTTDVPVTISWENEVGRVRMAIRAWPPQEMQQVYRVVYFSKTRSENHLALLEAWKKEQAEIAARKAAEEAARLAALKAQQEAERQAAIEAANKGK